MNGMTFPCGKEAKPLAKPNNNFITINYRL